MLVWFVNPCSWERKKWNYDGCQVAKALAHSAVAVDNNQVQGTPGSKAHDTPLEQGEIPVACLLMSAVILWGPIEKNHDVFQVAEALAPPTFDNNQVAELQL